MISVVDGAAKPGLRPAEDWRSNVAATDHDLDATWPAIAAFAGRLICTVPPAGIRRRAHVILGGTVERVARQDRRVTVWLREHPDVGEPKRLHITIADAALMLRVMVLEEHDRLIRGHHSPRLRRELISRRAVRVQL